MPEIFAPVDTCAGAEASPIEQKGVGLVQAAKLPNPEAADCPDPPWAASTFPSAWALTQWEGHRCCFTMQLVQAVFRDDTSFQGCDAQSMKCTHAPPGVSSETREVQWLSVEGCVFCSFPGHEKAVWCPPPHPFATPLATSRIILSLFNCCSLLFSMTCSLWTSKS